MEVFDAWEQRKLIMEDGKKLDGCIPKIPNRDITANDVDRTVGLRDSEMMMLVDAILAKEVSIKSNKISGRQQREGISLPEWCLYVRPRDVSAVNACILWEEENQDEDAYDPPRRVLLALTVFVCDSTGTVNVQAFAANSQSWVWSAHRTLYLRSAERNFRKSMMDPRPVVHLTVCYPSTVDQRQEFQTFSEFSGIKKELEPVWDEALKPPSKDWTGGKCSVSLPLLKQTLLPAIKKYDCRVINIWGGGNVTALALVSILQLNSASSECLSVMRPQIVSVARRYIPEPIDLPYEFQSLPSAISTVMHL